MNPAGEVFATAQPQYAELGVVTFPVDPAKKKPLVAQYAKIGRQYSAKLARDPRFRDASSIGFVAGKRNRITVLDIDTSDERELARALDRHGHTRLITQTPSGGHHLFYRHNGEGRQVRRWPGLPIDLIGGGL